jgi:DNA-binding transcriptional regulator YiaG
MTNAANHFVRSGEAVRPEPYEYVESGLKGIFLHSGFEIEEMDGETFISIDDVEGLHHCIGEHLILNRKELAPEEIRFLRKTMNLTQSDLARAMGQSSQQVARWEKGQSAIPGPADRLLRLLFLFTTMDSEQQQQLFDLLKSIDEMDEQPERRVEFQRYGDEWHDRLAA